MRISELIGADSPSVSFEFFPPKTDTARDALIATIDHLTQICPDFVSVTYGAGGGTRSLSLETCCRIQAHLAGIVMAHLTCVAHNSDEIADIADQLWNAGIVNIMALRGDVPKAMQYDDAFAHFQFAKDLISQLRSKHDFCIGAACYPEGHIQNPDLKIGIDHLKEKVDAGASFFVTQMFFDNESYFRFRDLLTASGVNLPVVPGIMPITGFSQLAKFEHQFNVKLPSTLAELVVAHEGDEESVEGIGVDWTVRQCRELLDGGAPGIHFYTLNKSPATVEVCKILGLKGSAVMQESASSSAK